MIVIEQSVWSEGARVAPERPRAGRWVEGGRHAVGQAARGRSRGQRAALGPGANLLDLDLDLDLGRRVTRGTTALVAAAEDQGLFWFLLFIRHDDLGVLEGAVEAAAAIAERKLGHRHGGGSVPYVAARQRPPRRPLLLGAGASAARAPAMGCRLRRLTSRAVHDLLLPLSRREPGAGG